MAWGDGGQDLRVKEQSGILCHVQEVTLGSFPPDPQEMPRYHELPTLEERSGPLLLGATNLGSPMLVPPGMPALETVSLDLEDEEEEEDYLDKVNPIYDSLSYSSPSESYQGKGFVMSRAMYV